MACACLCFGSISLKFFLPYDLIRSMCRHHEAAVPGDARVRERCGHALSSEVTHAFFSRSLSHARACECLTTHGPAQLFFRPGQHASGIRRPAGPLVTASSYTACATCNSASHDPHMALSLPVLPHSSFFAMLLAALAALPRISFTASASAAPFSARLRSSSCTGRQAGRHGRRLRHVTKSCHAAIQGLKWQGCRSWSLSLGPTKARPGSKGQD